MSDFFDTRDEAYGSLSSVFVADFMLNFSIMSRTSGFGFFIITYA